VDGALVTAPERSWTGAVIAAGIAGLALLAPIAWSVYLSMLAMTGCLFAGCETAEPDLAVAALWFVFALILLADVVLWGVAGHRRMRGGWLAAAVGVLVVPLVVIVAARLAGSL
jgi:hypothetical protein